MVRILGNNLPKKENIYCFTAYGIGIQHQNIFLIV